MHKNSYQIVLTQEEANTLLVLTGKVTGSNSDSPRKHADSVYQRLHDMLGMYGFDTQEGKLTESLFEFENYPEIKTPQQLKIEELEATINEAQKQLEELKGM